ncbi:MAG TPA: protein kinase [Planctomycetota bacterium]|nr:protein kinase [Planctomycetota bacterium]
MPHLAGKTLGDFHVERLVGKGSMAAVYQAQQISLRRRVALKVLAEDMFTPSDKVKRFVREAEALARLEHPHIVPIYGAGEEPPYYFFAMRLVPHGTLAEAMRLGIDQATARVWARQICQALAFAHHSGIVHRDLKPSNVLLNDGVPLLCDFGLARLRDLSTMTQRGLKLGTPLYMSPEQTLGENAGAPADCFALGVLLHQMFTGRHPFVDLAEGPAEGIDVQTLFARIRKAELITPLATSPRMRRALEKVVLRALERRPEDRYADAGEMLRDLEEADRSLQESGHVVVSGFDGAASPAVESTAGLDAPEPGGAGPPEELDSVPAASLGSRAAARPEPLFKFGRYEVLEEIGHGGQGIVYRAHDPILERDIALKVLLGGWKPDGRRVDLFRHEARVAARLNHPHIIQILDFGVEGASPYLTMPFVEGPSLDRLIELRGPLPVPFALETLIQVADALAFAHETGIVHLDVKPGNILIRRSLRASSFAAGTPEEKLGRPQVILTDFTMARIRGREAGEGSEPGAAPATSRGLPSGTFPYASPEQLDERAEPPGAASDIFSLGVVLHEMLTGKRLFAGDDPSVSRMRVLHEDVLPPSMLSQGIPAALDDLCARMLRRDAATRLRSAGAVIDLAEPILRSDLGR